MASIVQIALYFGVLAAIAPQGQALNCWECPLSKWCFMEFGLDEVDCDADVFSNTTSLVSDQKKSCIKYQIGKLTRTVISSKPI